MQTRRLQAEEKARSALLTQHAGMNLTLTDQVHALFLVAPVSLVICFQLGIYACVT